MTQRDQNDQNDWSGFFGIKASRRRMLQGMAATGVGLGAAALAAACQPQAPAAPAKPAEGSAPAGQAASTQPAAKALQPRSGGTLVHWNAWNPPTLDPLLNVSTQSRKVLGSMYNGLVRYDFANTGEIIPDLAEKWEVSPDGHTYTFTIRQGVVWHDGKPFGVHDVQSTYDRMKDKAFLSKSTRWAAGLTPIVDSWKTVDERTFQINFKIPAPYIMNMLATNTSLITPKHVIEVEGNMEKTWVGTGPFKLVKYEPGSIIELKKHENFWRKGLPYLDGISRPIIPDRAAQVAALASGQTMLGLQWPAFLPSEIELIKKQMGDKVTVIDSYQNASQKIQLQPGFAPLDNPKVRRAIFLAVDRWEISQRVFEGTGEIGGILDSRIYGDWALPAEEIAKMPGLRKDKTEDLAEAKKLLAEAGYSSGLELTWKVRNTADYIPTATVVASQLEKIGIKSVIKSLDASAGIAELQGGEWQLGATGGNSFGQHALSVLAEYALGVNYGKFDAPWQPKEYTDLVSQALNTTDAAKAKQLVHEMQRYLLTKDAPYFPVNWIDSPVVVNTKVHGYSAPKWGMEEGHDHTVEWLDA